MESICIHKNITGFKKHFVKDDFGFHSSFDIPLSSWILGDINEVKSLERLAKVSNIQIENKVPNKFFESAKVLIGHDDLQGFNWNHFMPQKEFEIYVKSLFEQSENILKQGSKKYFISVHQPIFEFLEKLVPATIDKEILFNLLKSESSDEVKRTLQSFISDETGRAKKIRYNIVDSKTGRFSVEKGYPQILTLRKDLRKILKSRHGDKGKIIQLDFSSHEARIASFLSGHVPPKDLYQFFVEDLFNNAHSREIVKVAVLSIMFGQGVKNLSQEIHVDFGEAKYIQSQLHKYFKVKETIKKLEVESKETGEIQNYFGRKVKIEETDPSYILYNYYMQSSAVDYAMLGFIKLMNVINSLELTVDPLYVVHDSLIVDVLLDDFEEVKNVINSIQTIDNAPGILYLRIKDLER